MAAESDRLTGVTLAVLAGGAGSRMGKPKAELVVRGQPILRWLMGRFAWTGPTMLVTGPGRERPGGAEVFDLEVSDPIRGEGPLRGVLTALEACRTELIVMTTVDMPEVGAEHAWWLVERLGEADGVMCRKGERLEPFPLVMRASVVGRVRERFEGGERSVVGLANGLCEVVSAPWSDSVWTNLNRPEEFERWIGGVL